MDNQSNPYENMPSLRSLQKATRTLNKFRRSVKHGTILEMKKYLHRRPDWINKCLFDRDQWTALHICASEGYLKKLKWLLNRKGIDVNARDKYRYRPLELAICRDNYECAKELLANGAAIDIKTRSIRKRYKDLIEAEFKKRNFFANSKYSNLDSSPTETQSKSDTLDVFEESTRGQMKQTSPTSNACTVSSINTSSKDYSNKTHTSPNNYSNKACSSPKSCSNKTHTASFINTSPTNHSNKIPKSPGNLLNKQCKPNRNAWSVSVNEILEEQGQNDEIEMPQMPQRDRFQFGDTQESPQFSLQYSFAGKHSSKSTTKSWVRPECDNHTTAESAVNSTLPSTPSEIKRKNNPKKSTKKKKKTGQRRLRRTSSKSKPFNRRNSLQKGTTRSRGRSRNKNRMKFLVRRTTSSDELDKETDVDMGTAPSESEPMTLGFYLTARAAQEHTHTRTHKQKMTRPSTASRRRKVVVNNSMA